MGVGGGRNTCAAPESHVGTPVTPYPSQVALVLPDMQRVGVRTDEGDNAIRTAVAERGRKKR